MSNLENALQQLREEHTQAQLRVEKLDEAISVVQGLVRLNSSAPSSNGALGSRTMSAAGRRRISLAQKARWAKVRAQNVVPIASKGGKRTISAAGRKRIVAAQKARWAAVRAAQKKAA